MKIILLHYSAPPIVGGVESVIGHHARLMANDGHEVCIVAGRGEQTDPRVGFEQIPLVDSRHPAVLSIKEQLDRGIVPGEFYLHVDELAKLLREVVSGADCLIAHNVCSLNKNLILTAALKKISEEENHPQIILWHHDLAWTTPRYRQELHDGYPWDLLRTAWPGAEQVTISEYRRQELASLMNIPEEEIRVIPNGVDISRFLKLETLTARLVEQLDLLNADPILLLPVRITPRKNIELALHVVAEIRDRYPRAALIVTGPLGPHNPANVEYFRKLQSLRQELALEKTCILPGRAGCGISARRSGQRFLPACRSAVPAQPRGGLWHPGPGGGPGRHADLLRRYPASARPGPGVCKLFFSPWIGGRHCIQDPGAFCRQSGGRFSHPRPLPLYLARNLS